MPAGTVSHGGRSVTYQSLDALRRLTKEASRELAWWNGKGGAALVVLEPRV